MQYLIEKEKEDLKFSDFEKFFNVVLSEKQQNITNTYLITARIELEAYLGIDILKTKWKSVDHLFDVKDGIARVRIRRNQTKITSAYVFDESNKRHDVFLGDVTFKGDLFYFDLPIDNPRKLDTFSLEYTSGFDEIPEDIKTSIMNIASFRLEYIGEAIPDVVEIQIATIIAELKIKYGK